jgi:selenide,water dikinase
VIATAAKNDICEPTVREGAGRSMLRLNRVAAEVARETGVGGATDITGFGLLGHATEMLEASGAGIALRMDDLPLLAGALALAEKGSFSGGMTRNRAHIEETLGGRLSLGASVSKAQAGLLFESETSVAPLRRSSRTRASSRRLRPEAWEVGEVTTETTSRFGKPRAAGCRGYCWTERFG